jgi:hypothetical protein
MSTAEFRITGLVLMLMSVAGVRQGVAQTSDTTELTPPVDQLDQQIRILQRLRELL